jgi:short-subunit dehydrogenase
VFGVITVTQKFLPLLRKAKGRIINISSINGEVSIPTSGVYSASKFALEAISDALRMELKPWGIPVSVIQPGVTATDIRAQSMAQWGNRQKQLSDDQRALYGELHDKTCALIDNMEKSAADHHDVTNCVIEALTFEQPFTRKMAGPDAKQWEGIIKLPDEKKDETLLSFWS